MAIKIKGDIKKILTGVINKFRDKFSEDKNWEPLVREIREQIQRGISPVQGVRRYKPYSKSYREAIKLGYESVKDKNGRVSPVNMTLSGEMLASLQSKTRGKKVTIEFGDDKAVFHNDSGAGKSKVIRRLLPTEDGETFNRKLLQTFREIASKILSKIR